ncbi:MAG TPA: hypothetical protein PK176_15740 [Acidobacteriota bacterium]|nr:hypothetical protein [Acidobacteriota bacterium]HQM64765.1 hypothetical protein [Acidobacteriota bacterium]
MADEQLPDPTQPASEDDLEEARRHWEQLHDDECYRDVHGVPTGSCLSLVLAIVIVLVIIIMIVI